MFVNCDMLSIKCITNRFVKRLNCLHGHGGYSGMSWQRIVISIILPVHNAQPFIDECLKSVYTQTYSEPFELSIFNDGSTDETSNAIKHWIPILAERNIMTVVSGHTDPPRGVGYAKNRAIEQSTGAYLCFLDADDIMSSTRIEKQLHHLETCSNNTIVGSKFHRIPEDSTKRYTLWANTLTVDQLYTQRYTSHGPTVIMPTWFCHRSVFQAVGGFDESGRGTPEDLIFFNKHLDIGGKLARVDEDLLMYRYHANAATFSVSEQTIWDIRVQALQDNVLCNWDKFSIWNAGKQGRKLYRSLTDENKRKVIAFCDVDQRKISRGFYTYEESSAQPKPKIPIVHYSQVEKPIIACIKLGMTNGLFEQYLETCELVEGQDFYHFN